MGGGNEQDLRQQTTKDSCQNKHQSWRSLSAHLNPKMPPAALYRHEKVVGHQNGSIIKRAEQVTMRFMGASLPQEGSIGHDPSNL